MNERLIRSELKKRITESTVIREENYESRIRFQWNNLVFLHVG
jgi:fructose-1,6-bisphosphatase/inositol monophosphatase family enzyme